MNRENESTDAKGTSQPLSEKGPVHVAVIMDGNGRWAAERGLSRVEGHRQGAEAARRTVRACKDLGIRYLTLYAFSTENWRRPRSEVGQLMRMLRSFVDERLQELQEEGIRLRVIGDVNGLPRAAAAAVRKAVNETRENDQGDLILALNYGGRHEIVRAVRNIASAACQGQLNKDDINMETFAQYLDTADIPDPDLLIRTSGEQRLSNFLLWQTAYTEFRFTETLWPDFGEEDLRAAVEDYKKRNRRFGGRGDAEGTHR